MPRTLPSHHPARACARSGDTWSRARAVPGRGVPVWSGDGVARPHAPRATLREALSRRRLAARAGHRVIALAASAARACHCGARTAAVYAAPINRQAGISIVAAVHSAVRATPAPLLWKGRPCDQCREDDGCNSRILGSCHDALLLLVFQRVCWVNWSRITEISSAVATPSPSRSIRSNIGLLAMNSASVSEPSPLTSRR